MCAESMGLTQRLTAYVLVVQEGFADHWRGL